MLATLTVGSEEDKKALISMLGKLYITANSSAERLRTTTALVIQAIDDRIAGDAASRNALNKLHLALSKAVGEAKKAKRTLNNTLAPRTEDGLTVTEDQEMEESVLANEEAVDDEGVMEAKDSLLEELLDDDEEEDV